MNNITDERYIEVPFNKSKIVAMLIGALAFVAIGVWFVIAPPAIQNSFWGDPVKLRVVGYAAIFFFGLCAFLFVRKLQDTKMGLIIDDSGILDHAGALAAGRILWEDIQTISVLEINRQRLILLKVVNPQQYIDREKNLFKRKAMELNHRMYKTPVIVSPQGLDIPFDNLMALLTERHAAYRLKAGQLSGISLP